MRRMSIAMACAALCLLGATTLTSSAAAGPLYQSCRHVVEAKTGNWEDIKCSKAQIGGEYVRVRGGGSECLQTVELEKGNYLDPECSIKAAKSNFIRVEGNWSYTSLGGETVFESKDATSRIVCKKVENVAQIVGVEQSSVRFVYFECKEVVGGEAVCGTLGVVETKALQGRLVYALPLEPKVVGMYLLAGVAGQPIMEFSCGLNKYKFLSRPAEEGKPGSCVVAEIQPLNIEQIESKLIFESVEKTQKLKKFEVEGKAFECELEAERNGLKLTYTKKIAAPGDVIKFAAGFPVEVKA